MENSITSEQSIQNESTSADITTEQQSNLSIIETLPACSHKAKKKGRGKNKEYRLIKVYDSYTEAETAVKEPIEGVEYVFRIVLKFYVFFLFSIYNSKKFMVILKNFSKKIETIMQQNVLHF